MIEGVFTGPTLRPSDALLQSLGATTTEDELGSWVEIDDDGRTSVPAACRAGLKIRRL